MNVTQLIAQTAVTFVAATVGAFLGAFLTRRTERFKHLQELRSAAYVDFLRGFAKLAVAQKDGLRDEASRGEERDGTTILADAKARIGVYGSKAVVHALADFVGHGSQTCTSEGREALIDMWVIMRQESVGGDEDHEDINKLLFGN
jgi:hypothetical protein